MNDQTAPGQLQIVRAFLNTWCVPNETRRGEDRLPALFADHGRWDKAVPGLILHRCDRLQTLVRLRDELRAALEPELAAAVITRLLDDQPITISAKGAGSDLRMNYSAPTTAGAAGVLMSIVAKAVHDGQWHRLKACPDCRWVFYDRTRNAAKLWCTLVNRRPGGRSCGAIAKARRHRESRRAPA